MARNQEKAMSTLNRWVDQRRMIESGTLRESTGSRFPSECRSIKEGEVARSQIVRRLTSLISQIQDSTLGEQRIRGINDEINRLLRSKYAWEAQISRLGGPDYRISGSRIGDGISVEIPGQAGYRYFGAARDLPGVRELFEEAPLHDEPRRTRKEMLRLIDTTYYGWVEEDNDDLLREEAEAEMLIQQLLEAGKRSVGDISSNHDDAGKIQELASWAFNETDQRNIEQLILIKKKEQLLKTFG
jgi:pre-mRNA-splicing factor ISY1